MIIIVSLALLLIEVAISLSPFKKLTSILLIKEKLGIMMQKYQKLPTEMIMNMRYIFDALIRVIF